MSIPKMVTAAQQAPYWYMFIFPPPDDNVVVIVCPNNHHSRLNRASRDGGHKIDAQGNVTPSCICGETGCNFHETVTLSDYVPK